MAKRFFYLAGLTYLLFRPTLSRAASGTEAASFLDIPVGAAANAQGAAYSAQANNAYATVWNPAGLGFLEGPEATGSHVAYLETVHYEHLGAAIPLPHDDEAGMPSQGVGAAIQYLGSGDIDSRDEDGNPQGTFTSAFAAYSLAYGQRVTDEWSMGVTGKWITEKISDATAKGYAADIGTLYRPSKQLAVAGVLANVGSKIKFVNEANDLPTAARLGATYLWRPQWQFSLEGAYRRSGLVSGHAGVEWRYGNMLSVLTGYNTARAKELGVAAGVSAGVSLYWLGQEFGYAWTPFGALGAAHTLSIVVRFSTKPRTERRALHADNIDDDFESMKNEHMSDRKDLYQLLNSNDF